MSVHVDDFTLVGRKSPAQMWKTLRQHVELDDPTSLLSEENLGCTQRASESDDQMTNAKTE